MTLPGVAYRHQRRYGRYPFQWRADDVGDGSQLAGLMGERALTPHTATVYRTGLSDLSNTGYYRGRSGRLFRVPLIYPRFWCEDFDGDGFCETPTLLCEAAATNAVPNSFAGTNTTGWVADANATITRGTTLVDGLTPMLGAAVLLQSSAVNVGVSIYQSGTPTRITVSAGAAYAAQAWVYVPKGQGGQSWVLSVEWFNSGGSSLSTTTATQTLSEGRQRVGLRATSPGTAASAILRLRTGSTLVGGGKSLYIEQVQLEGTGSSSPIPADTTSGSLKSRADERALTFASGMLVPAGDLTIYCRIAPPRGSGSDLIGDGGLMSLGLDPTVGMGTLELRWTGGAAVIKRTFNAVTATHNTPVVALTAVPPLEVLGHCSAIGVLDVAVRDAEGTTWTSDPQQAGTQLAAHNATQGQPWANSTIVVGGSGAVNTVPNAGGIGILQALTAPVALPWG